MWILIILMVYSVVTSPVHMLCIALFIWTVGRKYEIKNSWYATIKDGVFQCRVQWRNMTLDRSESDCTTFRCRCFCWNFGYIHLYIYTCTGVLHKHGHLDTCILIIYACRYVGYTTNSMNFLPNWYNIYMFPHTCILDLFI